MSKIDEPKAMELLRLFLIFRGAQASKLGGLQLLRRG